MSLADKLATAALFRVESNHIIERKEIEHSGVVYVGGYSFVARYHTVPAADLDESIVRERLAEQLLQMVLDLAADAQRILDEVQDA